MFENGKHRIHINCQHHQVIMNHHQVIMNHHHLTTKIALVNLIQIIIDENTNLKKIDELTYFH